MQIIEIENKFKHYLSILKKKPLTVETYYRNVKNYHKSLEIKNVNDLKNIGRDRIKNYIELQSNSYAPSTVNNRIATMKVYYYFLITEGIVEENMFKGFGKLRVPKPKVDFLETNEMIKLLDVANKKKTERNWEGVRDLLVLEICLNCGLRIFEVRNLTLDCINLSDGSITFFGKNDIERTVYLGEKTLNTLKEWLNERSSLNIKEGHENYLFVSNRMTQISKRRLQQIVEEYVACAGVKKVSSHKLRHTFTSVIVGEGICSPEEVQGILGHKNLETTQEYMHTLSQGLKKSRNMPYFNGNKKSS